MPTIDGANYTFTFGYADALGLTAANTRVGVYVDGVQVGSYAGTSGNDALNWQALSFTFKGNGKVRSLRVQLENGTDTSTVKGAMIDDMKVIETLPSRDNLVYGLAGGNVYLPVIGSRLADGDVDATLKTELTGIACGALLSDGVRSATVGSNGIVEISGWNKAALALTPPRGFVGDMVLQVRANSTEASNGSTATIVRDITVRVLGGSASCTTPAGMSPFVSYIADTGVSIATNATGVFLSSQSEPTQPSGTLLMQAVGGVGKAVVAETLEEWMRRMIQSLEVSLQGAFENSIHR